MKQYTRRTLEQWQTLVSQWRNSGQSAARFCETHGIGYASFCQWRKRLTDENGDLQITVAKTAPAAGADFHVDALSGATLTSVGVDNLVRFWMGETGYAPFLANLKAGEF